MSEDFDVLVWRANQVDAHGSVLTTKALEEMAARLRPGGRVSFNFDFRKIVGRVKRAWVADNDLYVCATVDDPEVIELLHTNKATVRPGFASEETYWDTAGGFSVINGISMSFVSVTPNPIMPLPGDQDGS